MTEFCEECDVTLDLHDGEDDCDNAGRKADRLDRLNYFFGIGPNEMFGR